MTIATVIGLLATQASGAAGVTPPSADSRAQALTSRVTAPEKCPSAKRAVRFYQRRYLEHQANMGNDQRARLHQGGPCPRYLAKVWKRLAYVARRQYLRWSYHWNWNRWLPSKWYRIARCETGVRWDWNSGTYQGAFGFYHGSWDAFVPHADRKAGPYPSEAYNASPRQQYEVALAIWRRYGLSGWGCRNA